MGRLRVIWSRIENPRVGGSIPSPATIGKSIPAMVYALRGFCFPVAVCPELGRANFCDVFRDSVPSLNRPESLVRALADRTAQPSIPSVRVIRLAADFYSARLESLRCLESFYRNRSPQRTANIGSRSLRLR
jgi:hypothetical protein